MRGCRLSGNPGRKWRWLAWVFMAFAFYGALPVGDTRAATQEEFFKSMKEETADTGDPSGMKLMGGLLAGVTIIMLLSLINLRQKREIKPKALNHPGKLLKEITRRIPLRPVEIKQLRLLAESQPDDEPPLENPLVMLLCPSVLAKSLKKPPAKLDRKVIAGLARKLGLVVAKVKR